MGVGSGGVRSKNISALITLKSPGGRGPRFEGPGENRGNMTSTLNFAVFYLLVVKYKSGLG